MFKSCSKSLRNCLLFVQLAWLALWPLLASSSDGQNYPKRKPGLWEVRTVAAEAAGLPSTFYCVGLDTDNQKSQLDRAPAKEASCTFGEFNRVGNGWLSESVCKEGRINITSRSLASGDFTSEYRIDTFVSYQPPLASGKREDKEALVAKYIGDCRPGQRVGEMFIPGMGYISMIDGSVRPIQQPRSNAKKTKPK